MGKKDPLETLDADNITQAQVISIFGTEQTSCKRGACKRNCLANPRCLNMLGEKRYIDDSAQVEINMQKLLRSEEEYAGLKNLGATCYANAYMQVWMHNKLFRRTVLSENVDSIVLPDDSEKTEGVLSEPEDLKLFIQGNDLLFSLQVLFTLLQHSRRRFINPEFLLKTLSLEEATHQDAQEFSNLFLTLLEKQLDDQGKTNTVTRLFQSDLRYVTACSQCGNRSATQTGCVELQLPVAGSNSVEQSMKKFFESETLEGENAYACDQCKERVTATRKADLIHTSDIFSIQMMRFVYDRTTNKKKKVQSRLWFGLTLNMTQYIAEDVLQLEQTVEEEDDDAYIYDLSAVVLHIGRSTAKGHFISHVRTHYDFDQPDNDEWMEINDTTAKRLNLKRHLGDLPEGTEETTSTVEEAITTVAKGDEQVSDNDEVVIATKRQRRQSQTSKTIGIGRRSGKVAATMSADQVEDGGPKASNKAAGVKKIAGRHSTVNGYMFVYTRRSALRKQEKSEDLPMSDKMKEVLRLDNQLIDEWKSSSDMQKYTETGILKKKMITILDKMFDFDDDEPGFFVDTESLKRFLADPASSQLNCDRCIHGLVGLKLPVSKPGLRRKIVQANAISLITASFPMSNEELKDGDEFAKLDNVLPKTSETCQQCIRDYCEHLKLKKQITDELKMVLSLRKKTIPDSPDNVLMGKTSYKDWYRMRLKTTLPVFMRKTESLDEEEDDNSDHDAANAMNGTSEDNEETVEHQHVFNSDLMCPHGKITSCATRRMEVSEEVWSIISKHFPDAVRYTVKDHPSCHVCQEIEKESLQVEDNLKRAAEYEKLELRELISRKYLDITQKLEAHKMYLVSHEFVKSWRKFIRLPKQGRPSGGVINTHFLCKHSLIPFDPADSNDTHCVWISEDDWNKLVLFYPCDVPVYADVVPNGSDYPDLAYNPGLCQECMDEQRNIEALSTKIYLRVCAYREAALECSTHPSGIRAECKVTTPQKRTRMCLAKSSTDGACTCQGPKRERLLATIRIGLSSNMREVKLIIAAATGILVSDQHLYYDGQELADDAVNEAGQLVRVMDMGWINRSTIHLKSDKPLPDPIDDDCDLPKDGGRKTIEKGFKGTKLAL